MYSRIARSLIFIIAPLSCTACASIADGRSQEITITTTPLEASCSLTRRGEELNQVVRTPATVLVRKSKEDLTITCDKAGYERATTIDHSGVALWTIGNIGFGGLVGWAIDSATGADNKYNESVSLMLKPVTAAPKSERDEKGQHIPAQPTS